MVDIGAVLGALAERRPLFHSEADFQHALAWELHHRLPEAAIRLDFPQMVSGERRYLDMWIAHEDAVLAIELKYKTRAIYVICEGENFNLLDQAAQPLGRYDFVQDIQRLERTLSVQADTRVTGWAIMLTNDSAYWQPPGGGPTIDADFRLHEGRTLQGTLHWREGASAGTMRGREEPLELNGVYPLMWRDYSHPSSKTYGLFRYLAVRVD
jgi:hypothetical protein